MLNPINNFSKNTGLFIISLLFSSSGFSDIRLHHNGVDKVYHPYVQPLEREIEARTIYQIDGDDDENALIKQRFGFGTSLSDYAFVEAYFIGQKVNGDNFDLYAYELEAKIQLTEQGEFWSDWGLLVEFEKERKRSISELSIGILWEKEWGRWSSAANLIMESEFGADIDNEFDTIIALQMKYRLSPYFEPALEFYADEFTEGLGPAMMGIQRLGNKRKLKWELGVILGLNSDTPGQTLRAMTEYEF